MVWATFWLPILYGLLPLGARLCLIVGFSSFNPLFCSFLQSCYHFLPYRSIIPTVMLFDLSLLGLFGPAAYSSLNDLIWSFGLFITLLAGSFVPFFPWASLAHLLSLGFLGPFSNSTFPRAFTNSFRLPWPNYLILHPWGLWACHQPLTFFTCITSGLLRHILTFLHHILPMGLLLLSFQALLGPFASLGPIYSFYGPMIHYSCHLGLMVFSYSLNNSFLPMLLGFFLLLGFPKNEHQQHSWGSQGCSRHRNT